jgi:signal recognition particle GTPase
MKIAFSGSHGTGKTTSVYKECLNYKRNQNKDVAIITEIARQCFLPINQNAPIVSQL